MTSHHRCYLTWNHFWCQGLNHWTEHHLIQTNHKTHVNPRAQPECFYHRPISIGYLCVWQLIMCKRINACNPTVPSSWGLTFLLLFLTLSYHSTNSPQFSLPPSTTLYHSVSVHSVLSQLIQQQLSTDIAICFSSTPKINSYTSVPFSPQMMTGPEGNTIMCTVYYIQRGNDIFISFFFYFFLLTMYNEGATFFFFLIFFLFFYFLWLDIVQL